MINIGENLRHQREINGYSQNKLAKLTGLNQQNISAWESNLYAPSIDSCITLADFYGISIDELIGRELENQIEILNKNSD